MSKTNALGCRGRLGLAVLLDALLFGAVLAVGSAAEPAFAAATLVDVPATSVCVTSGKVDRRSNQLRISDKSMRGVINDDHSSEAELLFRYAGPAKKQEPLASGEMRLQLGLKLRAQDTCNVVYVMWHVAPDQGVSVSVKYNPAMRTHSECGATGYLNKKPSFTAPAPLIAPGSAHALHAAIVGTTLRVRADGGLVWEGDLGNAAFAFDGPAGVRTDNVEADFVLRVPRPSHPWRSCSWF